jgi:hypothetical protein
MENEPDHKALSNVARRNPAIRPPKFTAARSLVGQRRAEHMAAGRGAGGMAVT